MQLAKIDIDFDIHRLIETERRDFSEPPYLALRRLLGLPEADVAGLRASTPPPGRPWQEGGVEVPNGSSARMLYDRNRQIYEGQFIDGKLVVNGQHFSSLSSAANALAIRKKGGHPSLNGWKYWQVQFPGENEWRSLDAMREAALRKC